MKSLAVALHIELMNMANRDVLLDVSGLRNGRVYLEGYFNLEELAAWIENRFKAERNAEILAQQQTKGENL